MIMNERDIKALKLGGIGIVVILVTALGLKWYDNWINIRGSLNRLRGELSEIDPASSEKYKSIVPVFEMPGFEQEQMFVFRDKFSEQVKKAGMEVKPLQVLPAVTSKDIVGYKVLSLKYSGSSKFGQMLDFLAEVNRNEYLCAMEEFSFKCDSKDKQKVQIDMRVSTLVKSERASRKRSKPAEKAEVPGESQQADKQDKSKQQGPPKDSKEIKEASDSNSTETVGKTSDSKQPGNSESKENKDASRPNTDTNTPASNNKAGKEK